METFVRPKRDPRTEKELADLNAMRDKPEFERCAFCGYIAEVVDTDYRNVFGRDTTVKGCKDVEACRERGSGINAIY